VENNKYKKYLERKSSKLQRENRCLSQGSTSPTSIKHREFLGGGA